jgi:hypothetical protein
MPYNVHHLVYRNDCSSHTDRRYFHRRFTTHKLGNPLTLLFYLNLRKTKRLGERIFSGEGLGIMGFCIFRFCLWLARALCILNSTIGRYLGGILLDWNIEDNRRLMFFLGFRLCFFLRFLLSSGLVGCLGLLLCYLCFLCGCNLC